MEILKSKVDYFDVKVGNEVVVKSFHGGNSYNCSYYKVFNKGATSEKIHYLFTHEVEECHGQ